MNIKAADASSKQALPFFTSPVAAGFPSTATDEIESKIDLNQHIIKHPAATFFVRVQGESMKDAGINTEDLLVVDRSLEAKPGDIILAVIDGEFTVKKIYKQDDKFFLKAENESYELIELTEEMDFKIWGVVTNVIKTLNK